MCVCVHDGGVCACLQLEAMLESTGEMTFQYAHSPGLQHIDPAGNRHRRNTDTGNGQKYIIIRDSIRFIYH